MNTSIQLYFDMLKHMIATAEKQQLKKLKQLTELPKGSIEVRQASDTYRIYHSTYENKKRDRKYLLKKDEAKLEKLSAKATDSKHQRLEQTKQIISVLNDEKRNEYLSILDKNNLTSADKEFIKLHNSGIQLKLSQTPSRYGQGSIKTLTGVSVRSKSELIISERLHAGNLEFYYEQGLEIGGRTYYPDFIIRHPGSNDFLLWEHCGIMDSPEYVEKWHKKLGAYCNAMVRPCENLIISYETTDSVINIKQIEDTINHYFCS